MKNKIVLIAFIISIFFSLCPQSTAASTITVPDDYSTIQVAVDASSDGDTISIRSGTYQESIIVNKQISLIGEGKDTTIIIGSGIGDVIHISSDNVKVSGLTIKGSGTYYISPFEGGDAGILLNHVNECIISDNNLTENTIGIFLNTSDDITLQNNICYNNNYEGIYGRYSNNNIIKGNNASSNGGHGGIYLNPENSYNLIEDNICYHNVPEHGIKIQTNSNYNTLRNNICLYNGDGIYLGNAHYNEITNNICSYATERTGITIRLSENNEISNNVFEFNPTSGIDLDFLNFYNTIQDNICSNNGNGINLRLSSHYNIITNNTCTSNKAGIFIEHSDYNEITYNNLSMNDEFGINTRMMDPEPSGEWNTRDQWDYAMEKFEDYVEERVARGITIESENSIGNEVQWNIIEGNNMFGINSEISSDIDATNNWWGDASGPFHFENNPNGEGVNIEEKEDGIVLFEPWLKSYPTGEFIEQKDVEKKEETYVDNIYLIIIIIVVVILIAILLGYKRKKK